MSKLTELHNRLNGKTADGEILMMYSCKKCGVVYWDTKNGREKDGGMCVECEEETKEKEPEQDKKIPMVEKALKICIEGCDYENCPYDGCIYKHGSCKADLMADALDIIRKLKGEKTNEQR